MKPIKLRYYVHTEEKEGKKHGWKPYTLKYSNDIRPWFYVWDPKFMLKNFEWGQISFYLI